MGIEPTWDLFEPHTGFEDQERHQVALHLRALNSDLSNRSIRLQLSDWNLSCPHRRRTAIRNRQNRTGFGSKPHLDNPWPRYTCLVERSPPCSRLVSRTRLHLGGKSDAWDRNRTR